MTLGPGDLVLSDYSLRGSPFEARVHAAAAAGFSGIGLNLRTYSGLLQSGWTDTDLLDVLRRHGQRVVELEALGGWSRAGAGRAIAREAESRFFQMADLLGSRYLQIIGPHDGTIEDAAEAFAGLCDRAAGHGLVVGIEFLPFTNIPDAAAAMEIVRQAGRPNGGLCVDSWHFFRGAADWEMLAAIPGSSILAVQINDGCLEPEDSDYLRDCLENRRVPGDGQFDLIRFLRVLDEVGSTAPLSVEVISSQLQKLPPEQAACRMADRTRAVMRAARAV
jgi:sugar phosphate isomerase/epimerase